MGLTRTRVTAAMGTDQTVRTDLDDKTDLVGSESSLGMDALGIRNGVGRASVDQDITYLLLMNENGTPVYIYPNAAADGIVVTSVRP